MRQAPPAGVAAAGPRTGSDRSAFYALRSLPVTAQSQRCKIYLACTCLMSASLPFAWQTKQASSRASPVLRGR